MIAQNGFGVCTLQHPGKGKKAFDVSSPYGVIANANIYLRNSNIVISKKDNPEYRERMKLNLTFLSLEILYFLATESTLTLWVLSSSLEQMPPAAWRLPLNAHFDAEIKSLSSYSGSPTHTFPAVFYALQLFENG